MSKRRPKRIVKKADVAGRLRKALAKRTKSELIEMLVEWVGADRRLLRRLAPEVERQGSPEEIAAATRQAISDATDFDERDINRNFDYDYEAYAEVKRNLGRLVGLGELRLAMELSLELMQEGSCRVEMSDEGLMTGDIEECLQVVVAALKKCDLPAHEVATWCDEMHERDRVGYIYRRELDALRKRVEASRPKR